jgi:hypothetical protein
MEPDSIIRAKLRKMEGVRIVQLSLRLTISTGKSDLSAADKESLLQTNA